MHGDIAALPNIREELLKLKGKQISLTVVRQSRLNAETVEGILTGVYSSVFSLQIKTGKQSITRCFSMRDVSVGLICLHISENTE